MNRRQQQPQPLRVQIDTLRIPAPRGLHGQQFASIFRAELQRALSTHSDHASHRSPSRPVNRPIALSSRAAQSTFQLARETAQKVARELTAAGHIDLNRSIKI